MSTAFHKPKPNIATTLAAAYAAGSGSMTVATGYGANFGTPSAAQPQYLEVFAASAIDAYGRITDLSGYALYEVTGIAGDVLTVAVVAGYADLDFAVGDKVYGFLTDKHLLELQTAVNALEAGGTTLPDQTGHAGEWLTTDGTSASWASITIDASAITSGTIAVARLPVLVGDTGAGGTAGIVPAPAAGDASKFLRGDATWVTAITSPGGSDSQLQYNNGGTFGGDSHLTWDDVTKSLTVGNAATSGGGLFTCYTNQGNTNGFKLVQASPLGGYGTASVNSAAIFPKRANNRVSLLLNSDSGCEILFNSADSGTILAWLSATPTSGLTVSGQAAYPPLIVQGAFGQSADTFRVVDSASATLFAVDSAGYPILKSGAGAPAGTPADGGLYVDTTGDALYFRSGGAWHTPGGSGTVTSVGLSLPSIFTVSGSPVTTSGTLTGTLATQAANTVFAGPTTGVDAAPTFRALVAADVPNLDAAKITTGTLPEARGGTNQSTYTLGDLLYASAADTLGRLAGNITTTRKFLRQVGAGASSAAPAWDTIQAGDVPVMVGDSGAGGTAGLVPAPAVGDATKYLKGDGTWATVTGSGSPGGSNTQVQFNDSAAFGGDSGLTYNKTTNVLTVGDTTAGQLQVDTTNTDPLATSGAHIFLNNASAVGQNCVSSYINGSLAAKWRTDYQNNVNWIAGSSGAHIFYVNGDYDVGTVCLCIHSSGRVGIGTGNQSNDPAGQLRIFGASNSIPVLITDGWGSSQTGHYWTLRGYSSTTTQRDMAYVDAAWADSTDASRKGRLLFYTVDASASREGLRIETDGSAAKIGFLGASAVTRPTVTGSRGGNAALASLLTALANLGLITDSTTA